MNIRYPVAAGGFYEAAATTCRYQAERTLASARLPDDLPEKLFGGVVPHAGWMYSGRLAAMTFLALARMRPLETVVLFGADHQGVVRQGEVFDSGVWRTPLGDAPIDGDVAKALIGADDSLRSNPQAHLHEHSLEVQVPLLQAMNPNVKIVPIAVPPTGVAMKVGQAVGRVLAEKFPGVVVVGSTDLTHHGGPRFEAPGGRGKAGAAWTARNDRRMIELMETMDSQQVVGEAHSHFNACGAGAIAATLAACREMGATRGMLLEYTNSFDIIHARYPDDPDDTTVGYASVVFA